MERKQDGKRASGQRSKCEVSDVCVSHNIFQSVTTLLTSRPLRNKAEMKREKGQTCSR